jgi:hypothetical protein
MDTLIHRYKTNNYLPAPILTREIQACLASINFNIYKGCGRNLRDKILETLYQSGWSESILLHSNSGISITSYKNEHGLCLQTGNVSRFYADLLKIEYLRKKEKISAGFYIIPTKKVARIIGSNIANFERFVKELQLFEEILTTPIIILGIQ